MLEWKRVQLMITNYIVMDEEFISKMLDVCAGKQIITWSSVLNISLIRRVQPPNVTQCQCRPNKSYNEFPIHASGTEIVKYVFFIFLLPSRGPSVSVRINSHNMRHHEAHGCTVFFVKVTLVLKWWRDL